MYFTQSCVCSSVGCLVVSGMLNTILQAILYRSSESDCESVLELLHDDCVVLLCNEFNGECL